MATKPVDFRKGPDGLAALVREAIRTDPFSGGVVPTPLTDYLRIFDTIRQNGGGPISTRTASATRGCAVCRYEQAEPIGMGKGRSFAGGFEFGEGLGHAGKPELSELIEHRVGQHHFSTQLMVIAGPADVGVEDPHGLGGSGLRGMAIALVVEDRAHRAVGQRADIDGAPGRHFEPTSAAPLSNGQLSPASPSRFRVSRTIEDATPTRRAISLPDTRRPSTEARRAPGASQSALLGMSPPAAKAKGADAKRASRDALSAGDFTPE